MRSNHVLPTVSRMLLSIGMPILLVGTAAALLSVTPEPARESRGLSAASAKRMASRHHGPMQLHKRISDSTSTSDNWAGYAVTGADGSVSNVQASWVIPSVACSAALDDNSSYASFWTGIDGDGSNTVEQVGTDSDCNAGSPSYYAWYEFYPDFSYTIGTYSKSGVCLKDCVSVGDIISAQVDTGVSASANSTAKDKGPVHNQGNGFTVTITDWGSSGKTILWTFSTTHAVSGAKQVSAEWITEADYGCRTSNKICFLSDFGTASYGQDYAPTPEMTGYATVGGVTGPLGSFTSGLQQIIMVDVNDMTMAEPMPLKDGTSFQVNWYNAGP